MPKQSDVRNLILAGLPAKDFELLRGLLELSPLKSGEILEPAGRPAKSIRFVESGIISLLAPLEEGGRLEVGHVGREGAAGVHAALGADMSVAEIMGQGDGWVYRADIAAVRQVLDESRALREGLVRFASGLHVQVSQTAACNGSHEVVQRLARWLQMAHDRVDGDTLNLTHEMVSQMLGVTRPGVTIAAGTLQKAGLIQMSRGRIAITDRPGLRQATCECYGIVAAYYGLELGYAGRG